MAVLREKGREPFMHIEKIYEMIREKIHENPVDKLRRLGAGIGDNVQYYFIA